jgi:hypothetical protein
VKGLTGCRAGKFPQGNGMKKDDTERQRPGRQRERLKQKSREKRAR